jgi:non-specific protein-tyrosine kinase
LLAAGGVVTREALDDSLKTPEEVTRQLGLPVLGVIGHFPPEESRPVSASQPRSPVAESYRTLRTNVQFASVDRPLRTLMITSADPNEGKTTVSANLAVVMAQAGRDVILLDCDFRRPSVHRSFGLPNRVGLSALFYQSEIHLNGGLKSSGIDHLGVMTSGHLPPNPAELLGSKRMAAILAQMKEKAGLIILDTPPTLAVTDASVLAPIVDGVLLVIEPGKTRAGTARQAVEQLRRVNARLLGVVLNNLDLRRAGYRYRYSGYHYYRSYRGYYLEEDAAGKSGKKKEAVQETSTKE